MKLPFENLFNYESPVMLKLSRVVCLILLNVLWLVCCLPIVTIGPATTAMHYVLFQYHTQRSDIVVKPFFKAFARDFKQSILLGIPVTIVYVLLIFNGLYIYGNYPDQFHPLWIPFVIMLLITGAMITYGFPLIARYNLRMKQIVNNSLVFFTQNLGMSLRMLFLNQLPLLLWILLPDFFVRTSFFWALIGGSLVAYINDKALLQIFEAQQEEDT